MTCRVCKKRTASVFCSDKCKKEDYSKGMRQPDMWKPKPPRA